MKLDRRGLTNTDIEFKKIVGKYLLEIEFLFRYLISDNPGLISIVSRDSFLKSSSCRSVGKIFKINMAPANRKRLQSLTFLGLE